MRIALIYASESSTLYPLPLLKIGAMLRDRGEMVELFVNKLPKEGKHYDEAWISTCFTYDIPAARALIVEVKKRIHKIRVGGIAATLLPDSFRGLGVDVHIGLLADAEAFSPDYTLLEEKPAYSIAHTTRGCVRDCKFCMVPTLEPKFQHRTDWEKDIHPETSTVLFYDNNWLAKKDSEWNEDVAKLRALTASGRIKSFDFNQGLDCRLMTEERAKALEGLPLRPIRFAFDGKHEDKHYQRAIRLMHEHGFNEFLSYVLWNFMDTPEDFYYRLRVAAELTDELVCTVRSFPMRFQPILEVDPSRSYTGKHWTKVERRAVFEILNSTATHGQVSTVGGRGGFASAVGEFELFFGKDEKEFRKLLNYPGISKLMEKRKGWLSFRRAQDRAAGVLSVRQKERARRAV